MDTGSLPTLNLRLEVYIEDGTRFKGATSRYSELFLGSLKIVFNWRKTFKS